MNEQNLTQRLNELGETLSPGQRRISSYLLASGHRAAFLTAADIASGVGVSESTVVRFARMLGFRGFPEMRASFRTGILETLSPSDRADAYEDIRDERQLAEHVLDLEIENLRFAAQQIDVGALRSLAEAICSARRCYVIGLRSVRGPAVLLGHYLTKIVPQVTTITSSDTMLEQLSWAGPEDVLIAFSFPRYSERTVDAIGVAGKGGARIGAITDSTSSPAAQLSDHCLVAPVSSAFFGNSFVSATAIVNLLMSFCTRAQPQVVRENLTRVETAASLDKRFIDLTGRTHD